MKESFEVLEEVQVEKIALGNQLALKIGTVLIVPDLLLIEKRASVVLLFCQMDDALDGALLVYDHTANVSLVYLVDVSDHAFLPT